LSSAGAKPATRKQWIKKNVNKKVAVSHSAAMTCYVARFAEVSKLKSAVLDFTRLLENTSANVKSAARKQKSFFHLKKQMPRGTQEQHND
jgi:hypothetical protein